MTPREEHLTSLVERPRESLAVELKSWIDPRSDLGSAKIVRTLLALRNQNGGFLVIGVDDGTLKPTPPPFSEAEIRQWFHPDEMQHLVSKYSSQSFELQLDFQQFAGFCYPIISVPAGIVTPVACKADLRADDGTMLLREGQIFVRTLNSNGMVSSALLSWRDLDALTGRCFENREADHARFLTKLISGLTADKVGTMVNLLGGNVKPAPHPPSAQKKMIEVGVERFNEIAAERTLDLSSFGFWDVALHIDGPCTEHHANAKFLEVLRAANPDLTGWPVWLDSSGFSDSSAHPYTFQDRWEAFVYAPKKDGFGHWGHLDFMIFDPKGKFFLRRALQDDLGSSHPAETTGKTVDPLIALLRTAEALAVGQAFARALGCSDEAELRFTFQWSRLKGREFTAWSDPMRWFHAGGPARQDEVSSTVTLPVSATKEALISQTHAAVLPLSRVFGGYELNEKVIREFVTRLLERKL